MANDTLNWAKLLTEKWAQMPEPQFCGVTCSPAGMQHLKNTLPKAENKDSIFDLGYSPDKIFGVEAYIVQLQKEPIRQWSNKQAMYEYMEMMDARLEKAKL